MRSFGREAREVLFGVVLVPGSGWSLVLVLDQNRYWMSYGHGNGGGYCQCVYIVGVVSF